MLKIRKYFYSVLIIALCMFIFVSCNMPNNNLNNNQNNDGAVFQESVMNSDAAKQLFIDSINLFSTLNNYRLTQEVSNNITTYRTIQCCGSGDNEILYFHQLKRSYSSSYTDYVINDDYYYYYDYKSYMLTSFVEEHENDGHTIKEPPLNIAYINNDRSFSEKISLVKNVKSSMCADLYYSIVGSSEFNFSGIDMANDISTILISSNNNGTTSFNITVTLKNSKIIDMNLICTNVLTGETKEQVRTFIEYDLDQSIELPKLYNYEIRS